MLEIRNLAAGYGRVPVVSDVDLTVDSGELVALLGRNGVGKTTLLRAITAEVTATSGQILLDGRDLTRLKSHERARAGVAYVPQGRHVFSQLTVLENLRVAGYASRARGWQRNVEEILGDFPILHEKRHQMGGSLSGGQQQILALGRALVSAPKLLLLDEPSEGIQPSIVQQIGREIQRINAVRDITVVLVEQNLEFAASMAGQAHVMDKGRMVRRLSTTDLLADVTLQHELLGV